ncbi:MAG: STAS domain-containing protein [Planctomycetes bacterium]|nr:STAS domain-containing protein [Planctomycetota bacterium]
MTPLSQDSQENGRDRNKAGASKAARTSRNQIAVARGAGMVVVRVIGMGNMATAPALNEFLEREREDGFRRFLFDMAQCRGLDSTFMGCMVGLCTALQRDAPPGPGLPDDAVTAGPDKSADKPKGPPPPDGYETDHKLEPLSREEALTILEKSFGLASDSSQSNPSITDAGFVIAVNVSPECHEVMGILGVDKFVRIQGAVDLSKLETAALPEKATSTDDRRRLILRAHENLVEIDKRNEAQFGAFLKSLSDELSKKD